MGLDLHQRDVQLVVGALLVEQRDRPRQVDKPVHRSRHVLHAVHRIGVAEQDAVIALGQAGRNLHFEFALQRLAAVRPQEHLHRDFVARLHLGIRHPGVLDSGHAALRQQVHRHGHPRHVGRVHVVQVEPVELVAEPARQHQRRGHGHVAGSLHGGERHVPLAAQFHLPVQAVGGFIHEFVEAGNGIVERQHHQVGRPLLLHEDVEVEILLAADGLRSHRATAPSWSPGSCPTALPARP